MVDKFIYGGKHNESYYYFYDIDGDETNVPTKIVAKEVQGDETSSYFIRMEGNAPIHHEKYNKSKSEALLNPTFTRVDKSIMENYVNYLLTKQEGNYRLAAQAMKEKGLI